MILLESPKVISHYTTIRVQLIDDKKDILDMYFVNVIHDKLDNWMYFC